MHGLSFPYISLLQMGSLFLETQIRLRVGDGWASKEGLCERLDMNFIGFVRLVVRFFHCDDFAVFL